MKSKSVVACLGLASVMLLLTVPTASALPRQCDEVCTPWSPPWQVCSVGSIVITCGDWWFSEPLGSAGTASGLAPMPIDQFLMQDTAGVAASGITQTMNPVEVNHEDL